MTLVFPDSLSNTYPRTPPSADEIYIPDNGSIQLIPSTGNALTPISQDTSLAFSVPFDEAPTFLSQVHELPNAGHPTHSEATSDSAGQGSQGWVMKAIKDNGRTSRTNLGVAARNAWVGFLDLIKVCDKSLKGPSPFQNCKTH